ncbi:hypothetical protein CALCODRAFT_136842 [Calocera cornea HHB12733]|uniref:Uncharacterized protein n=1 Tax=Calocera cornea HHB12733 TaxID=1353952 RepID=A0A165CTN2_9BASI|nr:hypothetical protein CALCODRAFT_148139 [Calocera cornea HHB12733]KZT51378.1 hypothetical protein CALCODRAFT_136842 [Calocera cornea HHB12733]
MRCRTAIRHQHITSPALLLTLPLAEAPSQPRNERPSYTALEQAQGISDSLSHGRYCMIIYRDPLQLIQVIWNQFRSSKTLPRTGDPSSGSLRVIAADPLDPILAWTI